MTNKPKAIGRAGENGVADVFRDLFPHAEPRVTYGVNDQGDIAGVHPLCVQVKSGKAAEQASWSQCEIWFNTAVVQAGHARAEIPVLVVKCAGYGPKRAHMWRSFIRINDLVWLATGDMVYQGGITEMPLKQLIELFERFGLAD